jgi:hypothetical protein
MRTRQTSNGEYSANWRIFLTSACIISWRDATRPMTVTPPLDSSLRVIQRGGVLSKSTDGELRKPITSAKYSRGNGFYGCRWE